MNAYPWPIVLGQQFSCHPPHIGTTVLTANQFITKCLYTIATASVAATILTTIATFVAAVTDFVIHNPFFHISL